MTQAMLAILPRTLGQELVGELPPVVRRPTIRAHVQSNGA